MSYREFRRWRIFNALHPIDLHERLDASIARAGLITASAMGGNKELKEEDLNVTAFIPTGAEGYVPPHHRKPKEKKKSPVPGLEPAIFAALGASDGRKRR